jgi:type II secretory pathway component PulF
MIKAGVNLPAALDVLATDTRNSYFRLILGDLKFSVENGKPLSEGLKHYPKDFNPVFINMIKAGEASGKLDESLRRLNLQLKKEYALVSKVKNALIYPVVLIAGVLGVLALIITFVIPRLVAVFEGSSLKIPLTTRVLFFLAKMASFKPTLTMAILLILLAGGIYLLRLDKVKAFFNRLLYRLPIAKDLLRQLELVRFARTLGELLASGLAIGEALEITSEGMGLAVYRKIILEAREKVIKGVSLANAFRKDEKYFPGLLTSVISVGEKTGQLDKILLELADFYEEQADNSLKTLTSLIEPVLLVIVGLLIGGMAISIVVPIYQLIGTI